MTKKPKKSKKPKKITKAKLAKMARTSKRKALQAWSKDVRVGGKCEICGRTEFLDAHHLIPKERFPELQLCRENGICLCKLHHKFGKFSFHRHPLWSTIWLQKNKPEQFKWILEHLGDETEATQPPVASKISSAESGTISSTK
jgi:hypothetical protein